MNKDAFLKVAETLIAVAFGIAYWLYDLQIATAVLIVSMTAFVFLVKALRRKLTKLQLISWLAIVILGTPSVLLKDDSIIKWKPTVTNALISSAFLFTHFFRKKSLLETLLAQKVPAPPRMLRKVNLSAGFFFLFLAMLNVFVFQNFSTTTWVNFKLFGAFALNTVFLCASLYYLKDYLHDLFPEDGKKK